MTYVLYLSGYRSVPLKNSYSEELELAALLVHIEIVNAKVHNVTLSSTVRLFNVVWFSSKSETGRMTSAVRRLLYQTAVVKTELP